MSEITQLDYVDIEIIIDNPLASSIEQKIKQFNQTGSKRCTIFRVPSYIRELNKNFYEPRIVSIGPYHWGEAHLKSMEDKKLIYAHKLLDENPDMGVEMYVEKLKELENDARKCYHESIADMKSEEFLTMLFLDSVFIIQVALSWSYRPDNDDEEEEDVIHDISWNVPLIKSDLLMLENQIPFFVLEKVYEIFSTRWHSCASSSSNCDTSSQESEPKKATLFEVLVAFLDHGNENFSLPESDAKYDHVLHFYYDRYMSTQNRPIERHTNSFLRYLKSLPLIASIMKMFTSENSVSSGTTFPRMVPCATELKDAGISFKKSDSKSIYDIKLSGGVLKMPCINLEENTRPRIMNLLAFEQCSRNKKRPFTSYAVFMDCVINTARDVTILQQRGVMENKVGDENEVAMFFNQLRYGSYLDYDKHYLKDLFLEVNKYCKSRWPKYRAKLRRDYFSNPWLIISFIAGVLLLFLTTIQSVYAVVAYYKPPH